MDRRNKGGDGISFSIPTTDPGYSNGTWTINVPRALPDITDGANISGPGADKLTVFTAYAAGTAVVLIALSVLVAVAREGVARAVRPILPYMSRIAGLLLVIAGGYLVYYWARLRFGNTATLADDPIVSFAIRFSGHIRTFADGRGSTLVAAAGAVVLIALLTALLRWRRQTTGARLVGE